MEPGVKLVVLLVLLTGSSQTGGQSSASPPVLTLAALPSHAGASAPPDPTEDPGNEAPSWTHNPAGRGAASTQTTTEAEAETRAASGTSAGAAASQRAKATVATTAHMHGAASSSAAAAADGLSSTATPRSDAPRHHTSTTQSGTLLTRDPPTTVLSSKPAGTWQDTSSAAHASATPPQPEPPTTATAQAPGSPLTSAPGRAPVGPTHQEAPSELNVGDEDLKGPRYRSSSPLDPLLAGLLSVFIITTAIVFVIIFLKFRQRTNHPEFHRLQDLPMDDLMEDTPLSRYTY